MADRRVYDGQLYDVVFSGRGTLNPLVSKLPLSEPAKPRKKLSLDEITRRTQRLTDYRRRKLDRVFAEMQRNVRLQADEED